MENETSSLVREQKARVLISQHQSLVIELIFLKGQAGFTL